MPFTIVRQDITKISVDAIVNAANTNLQMGGGVCGAIFKAAGVAEMQKACDGLAPIQTGEAVITPGFDLPAKFVIHTAGPVYRQSKEKQSELLLFSAYRNSLKRALENRCKSIAFPLISSGIYGYPKDQALHVASLAIQEFLKDKDLDVTLVVYHRSAFSLSRKRLGAVDAYIDEHYIDTHQVKRSRLLEVERQALGQADEAIAKDQGPIFEERLTSSVGVDSTLDDLVGNLDEPFSERLLRLIDLKKKTDVEVYKRANLDRKLFSKIRSDKNYRPSKRTAIALALALELSLDETDDLLQRAGYALTHAVKFDVIVEYFIVNGSYDIFEINEVLFKYDQPLLGG